MQVILARSDAPGARRCIRRQQWRAAAERWQGKHWKKGMPKALNISTTPSSDSCPRASSALHCRFVWWPLLSVAWRPLLLSGAASVPQHGQGTFAACGPPRQRPPHGFHWQQQTADRGGSAQRGQHGFHLPCRPLADERDCGRGSAGAAASTPCKGSAQGVLPAPALPHTHGKRRGKAAQVAKPVGDADPEAAGVGGKDLQPGAKWAMGQHAALGMRCAEHRGHCWSAAAARTSSVNTLRHEYTPEMAARATNSRASWPPNSQALHPCGAGRVGQAPRAGQARWPLVRSDGSCMAPAPTRCRRPLLACRPAAWS